MAPAENEKDLADIPASVKDALTPNSVVLTDHVQGTVLPDFYLTVAARSGGVYCPFYVAGPPCEVSIDATTSLNSVTITPNVAAVPEPSTYALMLIGLGALTLASIRRTGTAI